MWTIVGLGNPGEKYVDTRHNVGRMVVESFLKKNKFPDVVTSAKHKALVSEGKFSKEKVLAVMPETFMNNSGKSVATVIKSQKSAKNLVVVYDDLDLPLGTIKVSYNRGSGGHRGLESIIRAVKTKEFSRVRVGISSVTPSGKLKKPSGDKAVNDFIIGDFKSKEADVIKKVSKIASEAVEMIISDGVEFAMGEFN